MLSGRISLYLDPLALSTFVGGLALAVLVPAEINSLAKYRQLWWLVTDDESP